MNRDTRNSPPRARRVRARHTSLVHMQPAHRWKAAARRSKAAHRASAIDVALVCSLHKRTLPSSVPSPASCCANESHDAASSCCDGRRRMRGTVGYALPQRNGAHSLRTFVLLVSPCCGCAGRQSCVPVICSKSSARRRKMSSCGLASVQRCYSPERLVRVAIIAA